MRLFTIDNSFKSHSICFDGSLGIDGAGQTLKPRRCGLNAYFRYSIPFYNNSAVLQLSKCFWIFKYDYKYESCSMILYTIHALTPQSDDR